MGYIVQSQSNFSKAFKLLSFYWKDLKLIRFETFQAILKSAEINAILKGEPKQYSVIIKVSNSGV